MNEPSTRHETTSVSEFEALYNDPVEAATVAPFSGALDGRSGRVVYPPAFDLVA
jgi:hypothetical protein